MQIAAQIRRTVIPHLKPILNTSKLKFEMQIKMKWYNLNTECSTVSANCYTETQIEMRDGTVEHFPGSPPPSAAWRTGRPSAGRRLRRRRRRSDPVEPCPHSHPCRHHWNVGARFPVIPRGSQKSQVRQWLVFFTSNFRSSLTGIKQLVVSLGCLCLTRNISQSIVRG